MASTVTVESRVSVRSVDGLEGQHAPGPVRFAPGAGTNGQRQTVTLTASAFTALTVPSGAKLLILMLGTATGLTLKGITGDTGIPIAPTSSPLGIDAQIPLGANPSVGIASANTSNQTIEIWWF